MIIYKVVSPSNKLYFGISYRSLEIRKKEHYNETFKNDSQRPFHKAIRKYGDQLIWSIHSVVETWEEACELEQLFVAGFNTCVLMPNCMGYNGTFGGDGRFNYKATKDTKNKMSKVRTGKRHSEITKQKMSLKQKGKIISERTKHKISISLLGNVSPNKNKKYTEEQKNKMRLNSPIKKSVIAINNIDNISIPFISIRQCSKTLNINYGWLKSGLNKNQSQFKGYTIKLIK